MPLMIGDANGNNEFASRPMQFHLRRFFSRHNKTSLSASYNAVKKVNC